DGHFKITGLGSERFVLRTSAERNLIAPGELEQPAPWVSGVVEVSTRAGSVSGLEIRLVHAGVLHARGAEARPAGAAAELLEFHGHPLRSAHLEAGYVLLFDVPPGVYTLVIFGPQHEELSRRQVSVGEGSTEVDVSR